jgi:phosphomethylpyrimidine synthase
MKITEDVRKFAAERRIAEDAAIEASLKERANELNESGADVYAKR